MIKIEKYTPKEKGALKGYLSISIPEWHGFCIYDMAYFEMNGKRWFNFPQREYLNKEGEKKYAPYNGFVDVEAKYAFQAQVFMALDKYLKEITPEQEKKITYQQSPPRSANSNNNLTQGNLAQGSILYRDESDMGLPF